MNVKQFALYVSVGLLLLGCKDDLTVKPEPSLRMQLIDLAKQEAGKGNTSADCYLGRVYATGNGTLKGPGLGADHLASTEKAVHSLAERLLKVLPDSNETNRFEVMVAVVRTSASQGDAEAQFIMAS